jgi:predicted NUDIX family NTP pyrophosphohydrolase
MTKISAGILLYRKGPEGLQVFLAHNGGPYYARKDEGHWTIPKGLIDEGEDAKTAAYREFKEEIGAPAPEGEALACRAIYRKDGKTILAWAVEDTGSTEYVSSNTIEIEWPPRSGKRLAIPEVDKAEWFDLTTARTKIHPAQLPFLDELEEVLENEQ